MPACSSVKLKVLGPFSIIEPPTATSVRLNNKDKAMLTYLAAYTGKSIQRGKLAELIWPNSPSRSAKHSVAQSLYTLSRALPGWLKVTPQSAAIVLDEKSIDLHLALSLAKKAEFDALSSLITGKVAEDVFCDITFEHWRDAYNARLFGNIEKEVLAAAERLMTLDPRRAHAGLELLKHALPTSPALESAIRTAEDKSKSSPSSAGSNLPFLGRHQELSQLAELWRGVENGRGATVIVRGSGGQGKTRLALEFAQSHASSATVVYIRCFQGESRIALNVAADAVNTLIAETSVRDELPTIYRAALSQLLPELGVDAKDLSPLSDPAAERRLFEAVLHVVRLAGKRRPVCMVIDDAQWADDTSISFLHFLTRRLHDIRAMLVVASRPDIRLKSLKGNPHVSAIRLTDLTRSDITTLFRVMPIKSGYSVERLLSATGGNPFLLNEYVKAINDTHLAGAPSWIPSKSVRSFIDSMLSDLPSNARKAAAAMSVVGRPIEEDIVRRTAGQRQSEFVAGLDCLLNRRIACDNAAGRSATPQIGLRHDLIREGVYARIPRKRRRLLHLRAAALLAAAGVSEDVLAPHYFHGGDHERAHQNALLAVNNAEQRSAAREAIHFLKLAIRTLGRINCELVLQTSSTWLGGSRKQLNSATMC
jgi:hypothetical protein